MTLLLAFFCVMSADLVTNLPSLKIGTNIYRNVTLTKRSELEVIARYDGGLMKVKLADLPEHIRSQWMNEFAANAELEQNERESREKKVQSEALAKRKADQNIRANYLLVDGKLLAKQGRSLLSGEVVRSTGEGLLMRRVTYDRSYTRGSIRARQLIRSEKIEGSYWLVRNAPDYPTGKEIVLPAFDMSKTIQAGGVTAALFDFGKLPNGDPAPVDDPSQWKYNLPVAR